MRFFLLGAFLLHTSALIAAPAAKAPSLPQVQKQNLTSPSSPNTGENMSAKKDSPKSLTTCTCENLEACRSGLEGFYTTGHALDMCFNTQPLSLVINCPNQTSLLSCESSYQSDWNAYCSTPGVLCSIKTG